MIVKPMYLNIFSFSHTSYNELYDLHPSMIQYTLKLSLIAGVRTSCSECEI